MFYVTSKLKFPKENIIVRIVLHVFLQMTDVIKGGSTVFPRLGIAAHPVKGSAVFWYNLLKNGERNTLMLHGACPVVFGNKWGR